MPSATIRPPGPSRRREIREALGAMDTARATGIEDARKLYHAGVIARRVLSAS
jgi:hypothetical protein